MKDRFNISQCRFKWQMLQCPHIKKCTVGDPYTVKWNHMQFFLLSACNVDCLWLPLHKTFKLLGGVHIQKVKQTANQIIRDIVKQVISRGNTSCLYLGGSWFESHPEY